MDSTIYAIGHPVLCQESLSLNLLKGSHPLYPCGGQINLSITAMFVLEAE